MLSGLGLIALLVCMRGSWTWAATEPQWKFLYSQDGIEVFAGAGTLLPTFKAEAVIPVNIVDLLAVISDVSRRKEWLPDVTLSRILEGDIESRVVIYERINMPWPVKNRDCVVESVITKDFDRGEVVVTYKQVTHKEVPPDPGYVRIPVVEGQMRYRFIDDGHTAAFYVTTLDFGGILPQWVASLGIERVPAYSLQAIVKQVERTRGQYKAFVEKQRARLNFKFK